MKRFFKRVVYLFMGLFLISVAWVLVYKFLPVPLTLTQVEAFFELEEGKAFQKDWTSIEKMSLNLPLAMVAAEDQAFFEHKGFDLKAIEKALKYNERKKGKKVRGGSTISQQVAKNVFLWQGRSWFRKGMEAYFTILIEACWSKKRILEVYLNVAEMGEGIFGAQAAARAYFKKDALNLVSGEAALIAAVLPSPKRYKVRNPGPYVQGRAGRIKRNMQNLGGQRWIKEQLYGVNPAR